MAKKGKIRAEEIGHRLSGISAFGFGVSWKPNEPERVQIRRLLNFLEDRRVLYNQFDLEIASDASHSVLQIREEITKTIQILPEGSPAVAVLRALRRDCRKFLDERQPILHLHEPLRGQIERHANHRSSGDHNAPSFLIALGEFRANVGRNIAILAGSYSIDVENELASMLPLGDSQED